MKRNDIGLAGVKELKAVLENSKTVRILDLAGNNITDTGVQIIVESLAEKQKQQLQTIILADNHITNLGAKLICVLMEKCSTLQEL